MMIPKETIKREKNNTTELFLTFVCYFIPFIGHLFTIKKYALSKGSETSKDMYVLRVTTLEHVI